MANKIPIYAKIDEDVKERTSLYITKSKLLKKEIKTTSLLIEEALHEYMLNHPL